MTASSRDNMGDRDGMKYQHDASDRRAPKKSRDTVFLVLIILLAQSGPQSSTSAASRPGQDLGTWLCLGDILALGASTARTGCLRAPETDRVFREPRRRSWRSGRGTWSICYTVYLILCMLRARKTRVNMPVSMSWRAAVYAKLAFQRLVAGRAGPKGAKTQKAMRVNRRLGGRLCGSIPSLSSREAPSSQNPRASCL